MFILVSKAFQENGCVFLNRFIFQVFWNPFCFVFLKSIVMVIFNIKQICTEMHLSRTQLLYVMLFFKKILRLHLRFHICIHPNVTYNLLFFLFFYLCSCLWIFQLLLFIWETLWSLVVVLLNSCLLYYKVVLMQTSIMNWYFIYI